MSKYFCSRGLLKLREDELTGVVLHCIGNKIRCLACWRVLCQTSAGSWPLCVCCVRPALVLGPCCGAPSPRLWMCLGLDSWISPGQARIYGPQAACLVATPSHDKSFVMDGALWVFVLAVIWRSGLAASAVDGLQAGAYFRHHSTVRLQLATA